MHLSCAATLYKQSMSLFPRHRLWGTVINLRILWFCFIVKCHHSKDFKNYYCLQPWTGRKEVSLPFPMFSPYFVTVMQNKIVPMFSWQLLGKSMECTPTL